MLFIVTFQPDEFLSGGGQQHKSRYPVLTRRCSLLRLPFQPAILPPILLSPFSLIPSSCLISISFLQFSFFPPNSSLRFSSSSLLLLPPGVSSE